MRPGTGHRGDATHVHKGIFSFAFEQNPRTSPGVLEYVRERAIGAFEYTQHDDVYISIWDNLNHPSYIQAVSDSLVFDWRMMNNHERVIVIHHSFGPLIPVQQVGEHNDADATFHALTNDLNLNEMPPPLPVQESAPAQSNDTNSEETSRRSGRHLKKRKLDQLQYQVSWVNNSKNNINNNKYKYKQKQKYKYKQKYEYKYKI